MWCTRRAGRTAEAMLFKHSICLLTKTGGAERCGCAVVRPGLVELELWRGGTLREEELQ